jgi:DNA-binding IclR family transcriptional regulator
MLGPAVLSLGYPMLASIALRQTARPAMAELAAHVKGAVSLGMRERLSVVYVETSRAKSVLSQQFSDIGMSHPMIASAMGHAYLASRPPRDREALLNSIRIATPADWSRHKGALAANTRLYLRSGFCISRGEFLKGYCSVAVPLALGNDTWLFNCVMPDSSPIADKLESDAGPRLAALARSLGLQFRRST